MTTPLRLFPAVDAPSTHVKSPLFGDSLAKESPAKTLAEDHIALQSIQRAMRLPAETCQRFFLVAFVVRVLILVLLLFAALFLAVPDLLFFVLACGESPITNVSIASINVLFATIFSLEFTFELPVIEVTTAYSVSGLRQTLALFGPVPSDPRHRRYV